MSPQITVSNVSLEYKISDIAEGDTVNYYGFMNKNGEYYFMKEDTSVNTYRYWKGQTNYATDWADRVNKSYDYYTAIF